MVKINDVSYNLLNAHYIPVSRPFLYIKNNGLRNDISSSISGVHILSEEKSTKANVCDMCYKRNMRGGGLVFWLSMLVYVVGILARYWLHSCVTLDKFLNLSLWLNIFICKVGIIRANG